MLNAEPTRLAVIGSPIAHSKSPALHAAAYRVLALPWEYGAIEVGPGEVSAVLSSLDASWRGLSATMPVKRELLPLLTSSDTLVELTRVANTVLFGVRDDVRTLHGFNTDVYGMTAALIEAGIDRVERVQVLGAGATAASALVAVSRLGARVVLISARNPARAVELVELGRVLGIEVTTGLLGVAGIDPRPDLVISTLPNGVEAGLTFDDQTLAGSALLDVAYHPWPTAAAAIWLAAGGRVVSGLEMLVHQALAQVRIFVLGDAERPLDAEATVLEAMKASVGLAPGR